jgi:hypothetical protein
MSVQHALLGMAACGGGGNGGAAGDGELGAELEVTAAAGSVGQNLA